MVASEQKQIASSGILTKVALTVNEVSTGRQPQILNYHSILRLILWHGFVYRWLRITGWRR